MVRVRASPVVVPVLAQAGAGRVAPWSTGVGAACSASQPAWQSSEQKSGEGAALSSGRPHLWQPADSPSARMAGSMVVRAASVAVVMAPCRSNNAG